MPVPPVFAASALYDSLLQSALQRFLARATLELAKTAVQLDPVDSRAHLCCGWSYVLALREAEAAPHMELACELNDNDPWTLLSSAHYSAICGSIEDARARAERALALSPAPSYLEWAYHSSVRFFSGDYKGTVEACDRAQGINKVLPAWRAAALFQLGERVEAQQEIQRFVNGLRSFWVGSSPPTDEAAARWVMQAHPISGSQWLRWFEGSEPVFARSVQHKGMAAKPFMRPAFDTKKDRARDRAGAALRRRLGI